MATEPVYVTRERVQAITGNSATTAAIVDDAIAAASRIVDAAAGRVFYPTDATRVFDWPPPQSSEPWRLWLNHDSIISLTSLTVGGDAATAADFNLEPVNDGPPFSHIEADLSTSAAWSAGSTHQQAISIVGVWGYDNRTVSAGTTAEDMDISETGLDMTNGGLVGVGDLITVGSERSQVTDITFVDTAVNTDGTMSADKNDTTVPTADESGVIVGETIRVDDERMVVTSTSTGNLNVLRAQHGTRLATHANPADIFANRTATVERGSTGTTAAVSSSGAAITRQVYPAAGVSWCVAEAVIILSQQSAAWARTAGEGERQVETTAVGVERLRDAALAAHGRRIRSGVI